MKLLKLGRTLKEGWKNFSRNGWLSVATISVLVLSLYVISLTLIIGAATHVLVQNVEDRMNISVYFNPDTPREDISSMQEYLLDFGEIASVEYISAEDALSTLLESEKDNPDIQKAVDEIGFNPLMASLVIHAKDTSQYERISEALEISRFSSIIHDINFQKNQEIIERMNAFVNVVEKIGLSFGAVFVFIAMLITHNAIRLTLYSRKHEFEIMRLVGASNLYIKMPSIFEGMLYGFFSSIITLVLLFLTVYFVTHTASQLVFGSNLLSFYMSFLWVIVPALLFFGMFLGIVSSWFSIRRYLKI